MEPVLLIGGTGALGRAIAHWLRKRNPSLPITIAARDQTRARELAAKLGAASATSLDLTRIDLGLGDRRFGIVVPAFKDHAHVSYRFAQERGIPYLALSEAAFELAPLVAMYAHRPRSPLLLAGHVHGALPALVALGLTRHLARVESLSLGAIFDPNDPLPPGAEVDMERIVRAGPPPLALVDGAWRWLSDAKRTIEREPGKSVEAEAAGLTDTLGLWAPTGARSVRLDMGTGATAAGTTGASHEVIITLTGTTTRRWKLTDPDGNVALGGKGLTLAIERLLGLDGAPGAGAGLYLPETLLDASWVTAQLPALGLTLTELA